MHPIQKKLQVLSQKEDLSKMSLREIGRRVGVPNSPQKVKHHLAQLQKMGYLKIDNTANIFQSIKNTLNSQVSFINIPIFGTANCGTATCVATQEIQGYLQISKSILNRNKKSLFALQAKGDSMNKASIQGNNIEDGDYVIVDNNEKNIKNGEYVVSIIEGCANIKKFVRTKDDIIALLSESTANHLPIYIGGNDQFIVNGKVIQVIKKPNY